MSTSHQSANGLGLIKEDILELNELVHMWPVVLPQAGRCVSHVCDACTHLPVLADRIWDGPQL